MIVKVISGGQTGVDRMGLDIAKALDIETGGTAPKGYLTEDGPNLELKDLGLVEHTTASYYDRTLINIRDSDFTVLFGDLSSSGSALTIKLCRKLGKPYCTNPDQTNLTNLLMKIRVLNVAGNRLSKLTTAQLSKYAEVLFYSLRDVNNIM
ncbi:SLOG family protein [Maribacter phage Colly_1]|uniref:SLOG family protein n=1 Tax=Maribacter phage Colly_1 TaxID=2745691 RepID=A0A8E4UXX1_9CAUD|nr:SLOG family protein [Maribacter phage Colly_1]QQO97265.1 SLOG family protein [Maribacter phage Colly_1]